MITGFNTDISYDGRIYHVQTEDKGLDNPIVESLVYCGGEILEARRSSYRDLLDAGTYAEADIHARMESQHQNVIREIRSGRLQEVEEAELRPFGHSIVTNRSLDEVVLSFLRDEVPLDRIKLNVTGPKVLREGTRPTLQLKVVESTTERPICGAHVEVRLIVKGTKGKTVFEAATDETGTARASFEIPDLLPEGMAVVCRAEAADKTAEVKRPVRQPRATAPVEKVPVRS
jgi:hypothetical protein